MNYRQIFQLKLHLHLPHKTHFFLHRVHRRYLQFGQANRQHDARQTRASAHIQQAPAAYVRQHTQAIQNVQRHHFARLAHRGKIMHRVPFGD